MTTDRDRLAADLAANPVPWNEECDPKEPGWITATADYMAQADRLIALGWTNPDDDFKAWKQRIRAAERERLRAAVEGLPHVECDDLDCSHDDLSYSQREHPWLDRAAVLAIIDADA